MRGWAAIRALLNAMGNKFSGNPYADRGTTNVDLSREGAMASAFKVKTNTNKPWKRMKWFPEYHQWAINAKNTKRKSLIQN